MANRDTITRRNFLAGASSLALLSASSTPAAGKTPAVPNATLLELSAVQAVALMQRGELDAERYAAALLERCAERHDLNAFITLEPERVLEEARAADRRRTAGGPLGALHGLPIPIKDSLNTRDYPTTAGTPALRSFRPSANAPIVQTLVNAGAIVLGKTNLHELSYGWTSNNQAFGAVRNPYDRRHIPGGSSGGTAAAIAARMAPLGVAEDTEGSIRVPAALCGIVGFRPTTGRYSTHGAVPISSLFDQVGPHARNVADIALFDAVAAGAPAAIAPLPLAGTRIAIARDYFFTGLDPQVEHLTDLALAKLRAAGAQLIEADVPELAALIDLVTDQVQNHDVRTELEGYLRSYSAPVTLDALIAQASPDIRTTFAHDVLPGGAGVVSEQAYRAAVDIHLPRLRQIFRDYFARTGAVALAFPTTRVPAPLIGDDVELSIRGEKVEFAAAIARNIAPGSTVGIPGVVLPVGLTRERLPVAIEFDGPAGEDRALLGLALAAEAVLGPIAPPPAT